MTATFSDYRDATADLPEDTFLGSLVSISLRNLSGASALPHDARTNLPGHTGVDRDTLTRWFVELGLDEDYLPATIASVNAFRRVTGKEVRCQYRNPRETDLRWIDVTPRGQREKVVRHLMRVVTDRQHTRADPDPCVAEITYYRAKKAGHSVSYNVIDSKLPTVVEKEIVHAFIDATINRFRELCAYYDNTALRYFVRDMTVDLNAILVNKSGGTYFVHRNRHSVIERIAQLVSRLPSGSNYWIVPLLDTEYQRATVTDAFEQEVDSWVDALLAEVAETNEKYAGKPVPVKVFTEINQKLADAMSKADEHTRLLGRAQHRGAEALEVATESIADLAGRIAA